ncbi:response regulator [bacterium SCSIO 12741]|nr:response regulator [bacterium SCSIO 12741]
MSIVKRLVTVLAILLFSQFASAQFFKQAHADSLKQALVGQSEQARVNTLLNLAQCYQNIQVDSSLSYANRAMEESQEIGFEWGAHKGRLIRVWCLNQIKNPMELKAELAALEEWFSQAGYKTDAIRCRHLDVSISRHSQPVDISKSQVEQLMEDALHTRDWQIIGSVRLLKFVIHNMDMDGEDRLELLDSCMNDYSKCQDSLGIAYTSSLKISYSRIFEPIEMRLHWLSIVKSWESRRLEISMYNQLARYYSAMRQIDSAKYYFDLQKTETDLYGSNVLRLRYWTLKGYYGYKFFDEIEESIELLTRANQTALRLNELYQANAIYPCLGWIYKSQKDYQKALVCYQKALALAEQIENHYSTAVAQKSLASLYVVTGDYVRAESLYRQSIDFAQTELSEVLKKQFLYSSYIGLAELYREQKKYDQALAFLDSTATAYKGGIDRIVNLSILEMAINVDAGYLKQAEEVRDRVISLNQEGYGKVYPSDFYFQTGRLRAQQSRWTEAIEALEHYLEETEDVATSKTLQEAYDLLAKSYEQKGNFKKALVYHKAFKTSTDSIHRAQSLENLTHLQREMELAESETKLEQAIHQKEVQELLLSQKQKELQLTRLYIIILVILLVFWGIWFYQRFQMKKKRLQLRAQAEKLEVDKKASLAKNQLDLAEAKEELFANISHEFRTPLTLIQAPAKQLMRKAEQNDLGLFRSILRNTDYLLTMVDEILELSRSSSSKKKPTLVSFSLDDFMAYLKADFSLLFNQKGIHFDLVLSDRHVYVETDRNHLNIALNNLLKNAWHHCPEQGEVYCRVRVDDAEQKLLIEVENIGKGLDENIQRDIFKRHFREDSDLYTGSGLGLSICKEIVDIHGGRIQVDNQAENRVRFSIQWPMQISRNKVADKVVPIEKSSGPSTIRILPEKSGKKILIVEDNFELQMLLKELLAGHFDLSFARDGEEGEGIAIQEQPDLIVSDIMMPVKDGFELLKSLKGKRETSHIPVVLLTARADKTSRLAGLNQDADDYISKPFDPDELLASIHNLLRNRERLHQLFKENPFRPVKSEHWSQLDQEFLDQAKSIVERYHINKDFGVEAFCRELALSRSNVHGKMKSLLGLTASEFIREVRLTRAADALLSTSDTIDQVVIGSGFGNRQKFYRSFKQKFGVTPVEFRRRRRA